MIKFLAVIIISVVTSISYRCGGSGNYPRFFRPLGVGLGVLTTGLFLFPISTWSLITLVVSAGASAGLSTTYFKKKDHDAKWFNWLFVGLALSLAVVPLHCVIGHWLGFTIRTVVLTSWITLWSEFQGNAVKEELGRGAGITLTLPLLLI